MADPTNPVVSSFAGRLKAFQNELGKQGVRSVTQLELLGLEEVNEIYLDLVRSGNQHLADLIGNTPDSDFVQGNAAVVSPESLSIDESVLKSAAQRWGIDIDPDMPQIWRDKKAAVKKRIKGDVNNFDKTSLQELAASMFFEKEEQRTQLATSGVTHQYQAQLDGAVSASSPEFLNWFKNTMDVWVDLPAGYRSQFLADLQRTDEQAWADLIHETIYSEGERPSDITEIVRDERDVDVVRSEDERDARRPRLDDELHLPPVERILPPRTIRPPEVPGKPRPPHERNRPPAEDNFSVPNFRVRTQHPLDPEAWDRRGLGFLRALTPGFVEDWLTENYNSHASRERRAREYGGS